MLAVEKDSFIELIHKAKPWPANKDAYQREDGLWVYRKLQARELWEQIMRSTYDHAEPGILFLDRINVDNNLRYCESIEATKELAERAENLLLLRGESADAIRRALIATNDRIRTRPGAGGRAMLLVYFSGHADDKGLMLAPGSKVVLQVGKRKFASVVLS